MRIAADQFWGSNYYGHPALTNQMLRLAEEQLAATLPDELIRLLRIQNGGYTKRFVFPMDRRTSWADDHVPLHELFGIVVDRDHKTAQNILSTAYMSKEWGLPPRQVLLSGDGHWWITLDYRKGIQPSVTWIDVERGEDIQIAPSFSAFLDGLVPLAEFETGGW